MSTGNAAAAIGLANTNKRGPIGAYVQDVGITPAGGIAGPSASKDYAGCNGNVYYDRNAVGEAAGFLANANSGATDIKTAQWVTSTVGIAAATTKVAITAGDAVADNATGTHGIYMKIPAAGLPANSWFWAFEI
jgi:hypothetical protein